VNPAIFSNLPVILMAIGGSGPMKSFFCNDKFIFMPAALFGNASQNMMLQRKSRRTKPDNARYPSLQTDARGRVRDIGDEK
jgi:hypothetical protein